MFRERSAEKELIDLGPEFYTHTEYQECMQKLFKIHVLLGFFRSTLHLLKSFNKIQSVIDIGCGDGRFLLNLSQYFPNIRFHGIDINPDAIHQANQSLQKILSNDKKCLNVSFELKKPIDILPTADIMLTTLVCHHLGDRDLMIFLRSAYNAAKKCVVINDLHRHPIAYGLYALLSPWFRNRLISHDGLLSIRRGFTRFEWKALLEQCGFQNYEIKWCLPFRWRVILWKQ